jgi:hypothetical protein
MPSDHLTVDVWVNFEANACKLYGEKYAEEQVSSEDFGFAR